ncbi:nucleotide exchange factor GrpE [Acidiferrimicrobium sp. IK]|uniref:nucleotide exchange factor GrpE n=1 Tax=Acidiferrimicrobium sp. IK TaxID=2871700 RepID=UPI0021CB34DF|nr:nucleotide exchange factor GrpE [Acidiferrimicrobium sp. IK]MCU4182950.1 nucleotide exchange factor GrpE [Acidiferrimicrobium sp. IK]
MPSTDPTDPTGGAPPTGGPDADVTDQAAADQAAAAGTPPGPGATPAGGSSGASPDAGRAREPGAGSSDPVTGGDPAAAQAAADAAAAGATPLDEAAVDADAAAAEVEEDLDELASVSRQRDDYLDALRHLQADFENYKKRVVKQQADIGERAAQALVEALLPALDNADLALAHGAGEGVKQIWDGFSEALAKAGLERIDKAGEPFDPNHHDAVAHEPGDGAQEVAEVMRAGYRWKGRVIRPAMVKVRG